MRLVQTALRCYPQRWRSRHGEEAAELATLLMRDGIPARSIAWSYVKGAAGARLAWQPRRRLGAAVGALLAAACSLGVSLALLSSSAPASAARTVRPGGSACPSASASARISTGKPAHEDSKPAHEDSASRHGRRC